MCMYIQTCVGCLKNEQIFVMKNNEAGTNNATCENCPHKSHKTGPKSRGDTIGQVQSCCSIFLIDQNTQLKKVKLIRHPRRHLHPPSTTDYRLPTIIIYQ